ncbi:MAG: flagellar hook-associated protein FlgK [Planctomycetota bacterium]|jgi:flagellar hook-associated protein 1 FlgK
MSLFGSIHMASNSLQAEQIALQVVGQNIANASTPGYIREQVIRSTAPMQRLGSLLLGTGVHIDAIVQKVDRFLEERLRDAMSDRASAETQEELYIELEGVINELTEVDLSTSLNDFFSSISEILNQPESVTARNFAVLRGTALTSSINRLADRANEMRLELDDRVVDGAERINRLLEEIKTLNLRIAEAEAGDVSHSDAVGLRDQRLNALQELASLIEISVHEQADGSVNVYSNGDYLVFGATWREVEVASAGDRGIAITEVRVAETDAPVGTTAGEIHGLITARDDVLGGFLDRLDQFAHTLAFEFNKIFSGGQGLNGFGDLTSESAVEGADLPLDQAGLDFTPQNGSFQVQVRNKQTGLLHTTDVSIDGLSASVTQAGELTVATTSADQEFFFADDTSGILAALGLNTFFTGSTAATLDVSEFLREDPAKFAARRLGGTDDSDGDAETANAQLLAALWDRPIESQNGASLSVLYDRMVAETSHGSALTRAGADAARVYEGTLRSQKLSISGVNLDEEALRMIEHQNVFQASARYIATLQELLNLLVSL